MYHDSLDKRINIELDYTRVSSVLRGVYKNVHKTMRKGIP